MILKPAKLLFGLCIVSSTLLGDDLAWVDQQIAAIQPKRVGVSDSKISELTSPIRYKKRAVVENPDDGKSKIPIIANTQIVPLVKPLKVTAILNNSALIDSKWLKVNDTVRGYTIKSISSESVVLRNREKRLKLFVKEKKNTIKIKIN
jgi:hypothetical protein